MQKLPIDYDQELDKFLKFEEQSETFQLDERKLALEIKSKEAQKAIWSNLIRFSLPLAACFVLFLGVLVQKNIFEPKAVPDNLTKGAFVPEVDFLLADDEIKILDDWLLASPKSIDFTSVDYDSSYKLLVSLETIPLP